MTAFQIRASGYPASEKILASVEASFSSLDEKLFQAFLENKVNPIIGALEPGIYIGRYDFAEGTPEPIGVSAYVVAVPYWLLPLIHGGRGGGAQCYIMNNGYVLNYVLPLH